VSGPDAPLRVRLACRGVVQGVGFRPAVHRLASALGLAGFVRNDPEGAVIEVEGAAARVDEFRAALPRSLPPLARLAEVDADVIPALGETEFVVTESAKGARRRALVPPDAALCTDCRREMETLHDRRHRYPFTTCTNCGPRFTLVTALPYDRERTSMACFPLCEACRREYEDPTNRRFHAEPVCCPACGPRLWLQRPTSEGRGHPTDRRSEADESAVAERLAEGERALMRVREGLIAGVIVALKGFGGFQLACRADDDRVIARLRERKRRPSKPFALMVRDLETARALTHLDAADEALLTSARAPVVLAPRRPSAPVAAGVAPGLVDLGVMLPTTPLHVELFRGLPIDVLVMTSGNAADEPICRGNREALAALGGIADLFLLHDRDVVRRADDSVARSTAAGPVLVRRARGYVPEALPLPVPASVPVLALGPYLQAAACLGVGREAFFTPHVGDLDSEPARAFLREAVAELEEFLGAQGGVVVVDGHPDYPSTWLGEELAQQRGARLLRVQHHLAHAAATLAEYGQFPSPDEHAVALILDGTGWGPDSTSWGGEWLLVGGNSGWRRLAHLEALPLVGGEAAVREPWRVLVAALVQAGEATLLPELPVAGLVAEAELAGIVRLAGQGGWPRASGAGRVFEAAGALLGLAAVNGYEGEAAARFEALAASWRSETTPWPEVCLAGRGGDDGEASRQAARPAASLPSTSLLAAAARRLIAGEADASVAAGFHTTFCRLAAEVTKEVLPRNSSVVALGGGCLINRLLRQGLGDELAKLGVEVLLPRNVPSGDGGIAYGQAVLGALASGDEAGAAKGDR
jgi:hydrogenase maturation protein HypF